MIFSDALSSFDVGKQRATRSRLTGIARSCQSGRQVEQNLWVEAKLPKASAKRILSALAAASPDIRDIRDAYIRACESEQLKGRPIKGRRPDVLARVVILKSFCEHLVRVGKFRTIGQVQAWLRRQVRLRPDELRRNFRYLHLGGKVIWATFSEPDRLTTPFDSAPKVAQNIHDQLGLDIRFKGEPLLLFVYNPPTGLKLRFPTVADAGWGYAFRPALADPQCLCGLTLPHVDNDHFPPLPELVHEQVTGATLERRLEIIL